MDLNVSREGDKKKIENPAPTDMGSGQGIDFVVIQRQKRSQTWSRAVKT